MLQLWTEVFIWVCIFGKLKLALAHQKSPQKNLKNRKFMIKLIKTPILQKVLRVT
jgi:hypothetical protein